MKRAKNILLCLAAVAVLAVMLTACKPIDLAGEGTAYGIVGDAVGIVSVRTDTKGKIKNVIADEMRLPNEWGKKEAFEKAADADFTEHGFAKAVMIGGKTFTLADETAETPEYRSDEYTGDSTLTEWLRGGLNAKWYVEQMRLGNYGVVTADGVFNKFVDKQNVGLGSLWQRSKTEKETEWTKNAQAIQNYCKEKLFADRGTVTRDAEGVWSVDGKSTGVTEAAFNEYVALAQIAYAVAATQTGE